MSTSIANIPGKAIRCMKCHGPSGEGVFPEIPNLAGQKKLYLEKQINNFRATSKGIDRKNTPDERYNYIMAKETQFLESPDVREIAAYFSSFRCNAATAQ